MAERPARPRCARTAPRERCGGGACERRRAPPPQRARRRAARAPARKWRRWRARAHLFAQRKVFSHKDSLPLLQSRSFSSSPAARRGRCALPSPCASVDTQRAPLRPSRPAHPHRPHAVPSPPRSIHANDNMAAPYSVRAAAARARSLTHSRIRLLPATLRSLARMHANPLPRLANPPALPRRPPRTSRAPPRCAPAAPAAT